MRRTESITENPPTLAVHVTQYEYGADTSLVAWSTGCCGAVIEISSVHGVGDVAKGEGKTNVGAV